MNALTPPASAPASVAASVPAPVLAPDATQPAPGRSARPVGRLGSLAQAGLRRFVRGKAEAPTWERPALLGLLALTLALYLWNLGASGWANSFYSAAVQSGSVDWTAFFYGSSDAANSITVDKPPASLWLMALSVRLFGLSSWSILVPEALMGVATVGVVYATVRRRFPAATAALLAGGVLAVTPVAALMFRFNNPDALLTLLLALATYFTLRGVENGRLRWVLWAGAMIGLGFLTKQLQAFLILPGLAGVYLFAAPLRFRTRLWHSLAALGAVVIAAGWWVAIVELVPASWRPYIGGSQSNSFLELTFGYNGLGRLTGDETGSVTGGGGDRGGNAAGGMSGENGLLRLFAGEIGGQITWLLPAALILLVATLFLLRRAPRTSAQRAVVLLFGSWLLVTALAFSFMAGIFHAYYTVALAPPIAALAAIGAGQLWGQRHRVWARVTASVVVLGTVGWAWVLLSRAEDWLPWLKFVVVLVGAVAAVLLLLPTRTRWVLRASVAAALTGVLLAPVAYTLQTVGTPQTGSIVSAGPTVAGSGMGGGPGGRAGFDGPGAPPTAAGQAGAQSNARPALPNGAMPNGAMPGADGQADGGGMGGPMGSASVSTELVALLSKDADSYRWVAAASGSITAADCQLATELPVMPVGGFNGSDPSPTLAQFQALVEAGDIHYFLGGGGMGGQANGGSNASSEIAAWVKGNFESQTVGEVTVYDLSGGNSGTDSGA